jgi:predicted amidophosphoribosyltransferase
MSKLIKLIEYRLCKICNSKALNKEELCSKCLLKVKFKNQLNKYKFVNTSLVKSGGGEIASIYILY